MDGRRNGLKGPLTITLPVRQRIKWHLLPANRARRNTFHSPVDSKFMFCTMANRFNIKFSN